MAYNEGLADKVRDFFQSQSIKVIEKKMMGGLTFMLKSKMCVGILKEKLMARIGPDKYELALKEKGVKKMDFTGKPMKGYIFVVKSGYNEKKSLEKWLNMAVEFNKDLIKGKK